MASPGSLRERGNACLARVQTYPYLLLTSTTSRPCAAVDLAMIGDQIGVHVSFAHGIGMPVSTRLPGKFSVQDLDSSIRPDVLLASIADLRAWWETG